MKFKEGLLGAGKISSPIFSLNLSQTSFILRCYFLSRTNGIVIILIGPEPIFENISRFRKICMPDKPGSLCFEAFNNETTNLKHPVNVLKNSRRWKLYLT